MTQAQLTKFTSCIKFVPLMQGSSERVYLFVAGRTGLKTKHGLIIVRRVFGPIFNPTDKTQIPRAFYAKGGHSIAEVMSYRVNLVWLPFISLCGDPSGSRHRQNHTKYVYPYQIRQQGSSFLSRTKPSYQSVCCTRQSCGRRAKKHWSRRSNVGIFLKRSVMRASRRRFIS